MTSNKHSQPVLAHRTDGIFMKHGIFFFIISVSAFLLAQVHPGWAAPGNWGQRKPTTFQTLQKDFKQPDMIYAPFIFWFWDEPLNPEKMAEMSRVMSSQGFSPGYAHPRFSMVGTPDLPDDEWLGEKWFSAFDAALKQAEAKKNYLGYCDEYWWPSMQAHGRVLKAHPELRAESVSCKTRDVAGGAKVSVPASYFVVAAQLDQPLPAKTAAPAAVAMGRWIWHPDAPETRHSCYFLKEFEVPAGKQVSGGKLKITADNEYTLYVDGAKIGEGSNWRQVDEYDVPSLPSGKHVVAIEGLNDEGQYGLLFGMRIEYGDKEILSLPSGQSWKTSLKAVEGWEKPGFDAAAWSNARELGDAGAAPWHLGPDQARSHVNRTIRSRTLKQIGAGDPFEWQAPQEGDWRVYIFVKVSHAGDDGGRVNYIDASLAAAFIEIALEPYAKYFGERLERSIPGDFIDNEGDYGWGLAWSGTLDKRYRERFGRDIRLWMPLMVDMDVEGVYARARWEWFDLVSDLYAETFRAVTDWHERRGMYTTAHFWEEGIPPQVRSVGDHLKMLRALTMPGQDCLGRKPLRVHDFKEIESVAEFGNRRAATELLGAGGFEGTPWGTFNPPFLKQSINAVTAWGMSHIIPHGVFTTRKLTGNPWPPDWYSENPMFPYLHLWNDFARRAGYVNSMGRAVPDVLLFNPLESAWIHANAVFLEGAEGGSPGEKRIEAIERVYAQAIDDLTSQRVEFLVGDRYDLKQMKVQGRELVRDPFTFGTLVLPAMDVLLLDSARRIVDFARAGGRVYALGELPAASADHGWDDPRMKELMDALRAQPTFAACPPAGLKALLDQPAPGLEGPVRFVSGAFPMLQHRRRIAERDFFWLVNNADQARTCEIAVRGVRGAAAIWDCETGTIRPVASTDAGDGSRLTLVFKPYEAYWLVFDPKGRRHSIPPEHHPEMRLVMKLEGPWRVKYEAKIQPVMEYPTTPGAEFANGVEKPLEDWKVWGLEKFSGLLDYGKTINVEKKNARMVLDLGKVCHVAEVWVNGESCGSRLWGPHVFDVTKALRPGANEIRIRIANLINDSYGEPAESGLLGPVELKTME